MAQSIDRGGRRRLRTVLAFGGGALALGLTGLGVAALAPPPISTLRSRPDPASDYAGAVERFAHLSSRDGPDVRPCCRSILLDHGHRTSQAIVLFHGITNCPEQFRTLAEQLHALGHNVLIPRMPHNGLNDPLGTQLPRLTAQELRQYADLSVDIACGLGERVVVAGLSAGGVVATWLAQFRSDVDRAVVISPALGIGTFDLRWQPVLRNLFLRLPNIFIGPESEQGSLSLPHAYRRHSSRALGAVMCLGEAAVWAARRHPPAARSVTIITNQADVAVQRSCALNLLACWQQLNAPHVDHYEFTSEHRLGHDLIDPLQPDQRVDFVYPIVIDLILRRSTG